MAEPLYRVNGPTGCTVEVFDDRIMVTQMQMGKRIWVDDLVKLAELHARGGMSDEEFADAKRRLIGAA